MRRSRPYLPSIFAGDVAAPQRFHWLRLRATAHATEDVERVEAALRAVAADPELEIEHTPIESHHGGRVVLLDAVIEKQRPVRDALAAMLADPDARAEVRDTLEPRIDDDGVLYLRFDKQAAFRDGGRRLVTHADSVQVRCRIEVHPVKRERALAAWSDWLQQMA